MKNVGLYRPLASARQAHQLQLQRLQPGKWLLLSRRPLRSWMPVHGLPVHWEQQFWPASCSHHSSPVIARLNACSFRCRLGAGHKAQRPRMARFLKRNGWKLSSTPEDDRHSAPMVQQEIGPEVAPLNPKLKGISTDPARPSKWKVMGLNPSPELLAISMGEHFAA